MVGILGAANLANNIASATKGLAVAFGLANPEPSFPEYVEQGITAKFQREHWYKNPTQGLYSFSVEPVGKASISEFPAFIDNITSLFNGFFSPGGKFGEFKLPITPQEITQTEDFAVSIKPTQGGTVVNHSGNKYKTLTISGTTGVAPNRGLLGTYKGNGIAVGKPDDLQNRSGYEVFQHFRQWMRSYQETKSKAGSESLRMMFRNYKDWEFLYVEPLKFTMKRDATRPLLYNYVIQFKVIGVFTIDKPLFDLVVSKLNDVSVAVVNSYVLIKKNKQVTESITGTITDFEQSMNNLKFALKSANKEDIKLSEFTQSDANKLSYKESLQVLGALGNAYAQDATDPKAGEAAGTTALVGDPLNKGKDLQYKAQNPSATNSAAAKAELISILENEPGLLTGVSLDGLPTAVRQSLAQKQIDAALISRIQVKEIQEQAQDISDKLAEGIGLGDDTYNRIFGITPTGVVSTSEITDDQFEMLYALSQSVKSIDGILSSDEMFDTNARLFKQSDSSNGADSIGVGIFSFPSPDAPVKEGFLSAGVSLEDIALAELGDSSRWTEIAELNGLKAPYIVEALDVLNPNYKVQSVNFTNPTQLNDLQIGYTYLLPDMPAPAGAWSGKGNYLAEYLGGDRTAADNWRFIYPDDGSTIQVISTFQFFRYENSEWTEVDQNEFTLDGVLKPGDRIKIPAAATPPIVTKLQGPRDNPYTNGLPNSEKALGVDLKLTEDMDLDMTPSGDFNVAIGIDNAAQAIVLKILYEKGTLKKFPSIGTNLTPGKKIPDVAVVRADLTASLLQDTRIKDVTKINIIQENSALSLAFEVLFNDIQEPVPITIPI